MANGGMQTDGTDADLNSTDKGTSPSGASIAVALTGFSIDKGGAIADFNASSVITGGLTPFK